jgi:membrane protease YdiL (CAAX protease family)
LAYSPGAGAFSFMDCDPARTGDQSHSGLLALLAQMLVGSGLEALEGRAEILTAGGFTWPAFIITLLGVGILIPVAEELYFRGLMHNWFAEHFRFWPRVCSVRLFLDLVISIRLGLSFLHL